MGDLTALAGAPAPFAAPAAQPTAAELARRGKIHQTAQDFESSFLSVMMQQMFTGLKTDGPFGGGPGEEMFRSLMIDEYGKQIARQGGLGLADGVTRELLKRQEGVQ